MAFTLMQLGSNNLLGCLKAKTMLLMANFLPANFKVLISLEMITVIKLFTVSLGAQILLKKDPW